jgi:hypothetical protein
MNNQPFNPYPNVTFINFNTLEISPLPSFELENQFGQVCEVVRPPKFEDLSPRYKALVEKQRAEKQLNPFLGTL